MTDDIDNDLLPSGDGTLGDEDESVWGEAQELAEKDEPVGTFLVTLTEATLGRSTSSNRLQIHYEMEVLTGPSTGVTIHKYDGLGSPKQTKITQSQLGRIGINAGGIKLSELPAHLLDVQGSTISVTAKKNGDFYNVYFNKIVEGDGLNDDDMPF